ncbi:MAG: TIR domain-containing protein [Syntrophobacteraceae bacterium]
MTGKRKIFVSYHRESDQAFWDEFSRVFSDVYEIVRDDSPQRGSPSEGPEKAVLRIRRDLVNGTCCTVVLCGPETPSDARVDWEIKATLDEGHGLIGVNLPSSRPNPRGFILVPERLHENIASGYAMWFEWTRLIATPLAMGAYIEIARAKSGKPGLIKNDAPPRLPVSG